MPFINSKISTPVTKQQEEEIKVRLGHAVSIIPGKTENWLMVGIEPEYHLYFQGDGTKASAMVEVSLYGGENPTAFSKLTGEITKILNEVLGIASDRIYVKYSAVPNWGWNGSNF